MSNLSATGALTAFGSGIMLGFGWALLNNDRFQDAKDVARTTIGGGFFRRWAVRARPPTGIGAVAGMMRLLLVTLLLAPGSHADDACAVDPWIKPGRAAEQVPSAYLHCDHNLRKGRKRLSSSSTSPRAPARR